MRTSAIAILALTALFFGINVEARTFGDRSHNHAAADARVATASQHRRDRVTDRRIERRHDKSDQRRDNRQDHRQDERRRRHLSYRIGLRLMSLPLGFEVIRVGSGVYYYADGVFLIQDGPAYRVVTAPAGAHLVKLPYGYRSIHIRSKRYYFINETYFVYVPAKRVYVVVDRPIGA